MAMLLLNSSPVEVVGAIGAVLSSLFAMYLVHRRILADKATKQHRDDECEVQEALIKKLQLEVAKQKREAKRRT